MSKRAMKKVIEQRASKLTETLNSVGDVENEEIYKQEQQQKKKNYFTAAMLRGSESESADEQQQENEQIEDTIQINKTKKKKKSANPKKLKEADDEIDFLDSQIVQQEESKTQDIYFKSGKTQLHGCLEIMISKLNYNKEISKHFKNTKLTDSTEPRRTKGRQLPKHKNAKQHKLVYNQDIKIQLQCKFQCDQIDLNEQGLKVYIFTSTPSYESVAKQYQGVKSSLNPQQMFDFLQHHPQYCEALYDVSEYFRLKGDYKQANQLLETLLQIFEESLGYDFGKDIFEEATITKELQLNSYSHTFFMTLFKFTDILGKKGCYRSALEFTKLLLKVSPTNDPTGSLMLIDYNCISASQYDYLVYLAQNFGREVYKNPKYSLAYMPNFIYNCALAKFLSARQDDTEFKPDVTQQDFDDAIMNFHNEQPLKANYNVLLIQAILLYPSVILQLSNKNEYTKQHVSNCDTYVGWQRKSIKELFDLDFLLRETYLYWFLGLENDDDSLGLQRTIEIFVEKNKSLWKHAHIIQWVKGVIGMIQNQIENNQFDQMTFYQKVSCLEEDQKIMNHIPFQFRRYKGLAKSHFSDQERLDFNNLYAENIGANQVQQRNPRFNGVNQNQGMLGVILDSLFPWIHNPTAANMQNDQQDDQ